MTFFFLKEKMNREMWYCFSSLFFHRDNAQSEIF